MAQNIKKILKTPLLYLSPLALTGCNKTTNNLKATTKSVHWADSQPTQTSRAADGNYYDDNPYEEIDDDHLYEIPKRSLNPDPIIKRERMAAAAEKRQRQAEAFNAIEALEAAVEAAVRNIAEQKAQAKTRAEIREKAAAAAERRQKKAEEKKSVITSDFTMEIREEIEITKSEPRRRPNAQIIAEEEQKRLAQQRQKASEVGRSIARAMQQHEIEQIEREREEKEKKRKLAAVQLAAIQQSMASATQQIENPKIAERLAAVVNRKKAEQIQREKLAKHNNTLIKHLQSARKYVSYWLNIK